MRFESYKQTSSDEVKQKKIEVKSNDREFLQLLDNLTLKERNDYDRLMLDLKFGYVIGIEKQFSTKLPEHILKSPQVTEKMARAWLEKLAESDGTFDFLHNVVRGGVKAEILKSPEIKDVSKKAWLKFLEEGRDFDPAMMTIETDRIKRYVQDENEISFLQKIYGALPETGLSIRDPEVRQAAVKGIVFHCLRNKDFKKADKYIECFDISEEELKGELIKTLKDNLDDTDDLEALKNKFNFVKDYLESPQAKNDAKKLVYSRLSADKYYSSLHKIEEYFNIPVSDFDQQALADAAEANLKQEGYHPSGKFKDSYEDLSTYLDDKRLGEIFTKAMRLDPKTWEKRLAYVFSNYDADKSFEIFKHLNLPEDIFRRAGIRILADEIKTHHKLDERIKNKVRERFNFSDDDIAEAITIGRIDLIADRSWSKDLENEAIVKNAHTIDYAKDSYINLLKNGSFDRLETLNDLIPIEWEKDDQRILEREWAIGEAVKNGWIFYSGYGTNFGRVKELIQEYYPSNNKQFLFGDPEVKERLEQEIISTIEKAGSRFSRETADFIFYANLSREDIVSKLEKKLGFIDEDLATCIKFSLSKYDDKGERIPWLSDSASIDTEKHNTEWFKDSGEKSIRYLLEAHNWRELQSIYQIDRGKELIGKNLAHYGKEIISDLLAEDDPKLNDLESLAAFPEVWDDLRSSLLKKSGEFIDGLFKRNERNNLKRVFAASSQTAEIVDRNLGDHKFSTLGTLARFPESESYVHGYVKRHFDEVREYINKNSVEYFRFLLKYPEVKAFITETVFKNPNSLIHCLDSFSIPKEIEEVYLAYAEAQPEAWAECILFSPENAQLLSNLALYPSLHKNLQEYVKENSEKIISKILIGFNSDQFAGLLKKIPELNEPLKKHLDDFNIEELFKNFSTSDKESSSFLEYVSERSAFHNGEGQEYMFFLIQEDAKRVFEKMRDWRNLDLLQQATKNLVYDNLPDASKSKIFETFLTVMKKGGLDMPSFPFYYDIICSQDIRKMIEDGSIYNYRFYAILPIVYSLNVPYANLPARFKKELLHEFVVDESRGLNFSQYRDDVLQSKELKQFIDNGELYDLRPREGLTLALKVGLHFTDFPDDYKKEIQDDFFANISRAGSSYSYPYMKDIMATDTFKNFLKSEACHSIAADYLVDLGRKAKFDYADFSSETQEKITDYFVDQINHGSYYKNITYYNDIIHSRPFKELIAKGSFYNSNTSIESVFDIAQELKINFTDFPKNYRQQIVRWYMDLRRGRGIGETDDRFNVIINSEEYKEFLSQADASLKRLEMLKDYNEDKLDLPETIQRKIGIVKVKAPGKGRTLAGLAILSGYAPEKETMLRNIETTLDRLVSNLDLCPWNSIPKGLHVSMGMEYEVTSTVGRTYNEKSWGGYKHDIETVSDACNIGRGKDGLHEIATKPTENPYAVLAEMKLLQESGFVDFNKKIYTHAGSGYHFTVSGEEGIGTSTDMFFLQNSLIISGWGGINAGRPSAPGGIRERGLDNDLQPLFNNQRENLGIELRGNSIDAWEPFEKSVITMFNAAIAAQARKKFISDSDFYITASTFPENPQALKKMLRKEKKLVAHENLGDKELHILYEWEKLKYDMAQALQDHNRGFADSEFHGGYINQADKYIDTEDQIDIRRNKNLLKEQSITPSDLTHLSSLSSDKLFSALDAKFMQALTFTNNIFLKPPGKHEQSAINSTSINAASVLANVKKEGYKSVDRKYSYTDSVFERGYVDFDTYYCYQGASEEMITHKSQILLNRFNKHMQEILKEPEVAQKEKYEYA